MHPRSPSLTIIVDLSDLSCDEIPSGILLWCKFIDFIATSVDRSYTLSLFKPDLLLFPTLLSTLEQHFSILWTDEAVRTPNLAQDFLYVSSSQVLTKKHLNHFDHLYIKPTALPELLSVDFYYDHAWATVEKLNSSNTPPKLITPTLYASKVGVISSIFNGDTFLTGFLDNSASWSLYSECEHLLIRAGSSGNESLLLIEHVAQHSNAIYINLVNDPGLYAVWNLGAQLSSCPYLTNANIDDRRAPNQVSKLVRYLNEHPDISLVSADLHITETENQTWKDKTTKSLPVMFGAMPKNIYTIGEMFRSEGKGLASRNFPHCMPIWRRQLHYTAGWFCEDRYGPSADWEFWLRSGIQGACYAYLSEPLGLYLKHEASYWRRQKTSDFDQRIVDEYASFARKDLLFDSNSQPFSQRVTRTLSAYQADDALGFFCGLAYCALKVNKPQATSSESCLLNAVARKTLGMDDFCLFVAQNNHVFFDHSDSIKNALSLVVELLHCKHTKNNITPHHKFQAFLQSFFIDFHGLGYALSSVIALIGLAFLKHQQGDTSGEIKLLSAAYHQDSIQFWTSIADIYRFKVSLNELTCKLTSIATASRSASEKFKKCNSLGSSSSVTHILPKQHEGKTEVTRLKEDKQTFNHLALWFYPVATNNKYQRLLYSDSAIQGAQVIGITDLKQFSNLKLVPESDNIIHIHWISEFVTTSNTDVFPQNKADKFLRQLQQLQSFGFDIRWTIHNAVSHDAKHKDKEVRFRQALFQLVDRVYIHHPLALSLLEWLPSDSAKYALIEHGHYLSLCTATMSKADARNQLGIDQNSFVIFYFGMLRDYKGLGEYLPVFEKISRDCPHVKLIIAGQIQSKAIMHMLNTLDCPNIIVYDKFLTDEELAIYNLAADTGFLSYRSILTSGTLFHMMSAKLPVIAPALGTLPAYIAKGWNGFVYETEHDLDKILRHCCQLPEKSISVMGENSYQLASSLKWVFF